MRLSKLIPGVRARIKRLEIPGELNEKLVGMGFIPEEEIEIVRVAPFGDPIVCRIGERNITLRKKEADFIEVEVLSEELPLLLAEDGIYEITDLKGGRRFLTRMKALGVEKGKKISVLRGRYNMEGKEIPLGRGEAMKIWVRRVDDAGEESDPQK
ncbi:MULTISPECIES: FeoA domain-containing protein [Thermotoga]|uniref:FeoA family protein n=1 Tax=Thermotoga neapolitana (strain ATCC 49049 / DSM 4359 / NBRC 107923 / NS-E) TaxID=309803 RepID=B9K787_THENN|nr:MULTISPECIES: FeoA domain-containing protein [Thermotoga]MDK2786327.1 ferrous iron transport protein [Thermotoga sp.]HBF10545.1 iron transporter FeoA [Thermotoga neapolitana]ACM22820.1 FeoA family protein [Thermotoga neapolitana DSM 4359]AJG40757.1 iron transporter FeoA [Thermotoga sp. RQ7]KFZ22074.1 FeoA family protein [Thermotoga neapolitana LA10]